MNSAASSDNSHTNTTLQSTCGNCRTPVFYSEISRKSETKCSACKKTTHIIVFPEIFYDSEMPSLDRNPVITDECSCYYHTEKQAVVYCRECGKFLCQLCDIEMKEQHYCGNCLDHARKSEKIESLITHRRRYDSIALLISLAPLLMIYLIVFTAPATVYLCIRHWNSPGSLVFNNRWRMATAMIIAVTQIGVLLYLMSNLLLSLA